MNTSPKEAAPERHPLQDILDKENETGDWTQSKLVCALIIEKDNLKSQIATLQQQYKLKCGLMDEAHVLIAKLEKELASLQAQRRKDVEDVLTKENELQKSCWVTIKGLRHFDADRYRRELKEYLTKYDQTKTEGV